MFKGKTKSKAAELGSGGGRSGGGSAAATTLGSGNLRAAVALPEGEDVNEWLAVAAVDFFHQVNMLFATLQDFCTEESCPSMSAGPKYKYFWSDGTRKPEDVCACKYVFSLMEWIQAQLEDDAVFPSRLAGPFPKVSRARGVVVCSCVVVICCAV
jgi:MOB kinase activator 1